MALGLKGQVLTPETAGALVPKVMLMVVLGEVISFVLGYFLMQFDQKKLQPALKKKFGA